MRQSLLTAISAYSRIGDKSFSATYRRATGNNHRFCRQERDHMRKALVTIACHAATVVLAMVVRNTLTPKEYCRFRFGPDEPLEVIIARSGRSLLVFRDGDPSSIAEVYDFADGKLANEAAIPEFTDKGGTRYAITSVSEYSDDGPPSRHAIMAHVVINRGDESSFRQYCDVALSRSIADADYCHFDGPLEIGPIAKYNLIATKTELARGSSPSDIRALVGTFDEDGGCWTVLESGDGKYPAGVFPHLTVDYTIDGSSTLSQSYDLDQFC